MYLEYLFLENTYIEELKKYEYKYDVTYKDCVTRIIKSKKYITEINNEKKWIVRFEIENYSGTQENAKHLSYINTDIIEKYNPTVLRNDSAAYFNKELYPLVNEFERQLRRLLYIKNALYEEEKGKKNIENIENLDLGEIYRLLFVDEDFCKDIKSIVNGSKNGEGGYFSKQEIIKKISASNELTVWDKIVGVNTLSAIKDNFLDIKEYRNSVMHARNISYEDYMLYRRQLNKVIKELEEEIENTIKYPDSEEHYEAVVSSVYDSILKLTSQIQQSVGYMLQTLDFEKIYSYFSNFQNLYKYYNLNNSELFNSKLTDDELPNNKDDSLSDDPNK